MSEKCSRPSLHLRLVQMSDMTTQPERGALLRQLLGFVRSNAPRSVTLLHEPPKWVGTARRAIRAGRASARSARFTGGDIAGHVLTLEIRTCPCRHSLAEHSFASRLESAAASSITVGTDVRPDLTLKHGHAQLPASRLPKSADNFSRHNS
jgi:hypothetical protein